MASGAHASDWSTSNWVDYPEGGWSDIDRSLIPQRNITTASASQPDVAMIDADSGHAPGPHHDLPYDDHEADWGEPRDDVR